MENHWFQQLPILQLELHSQSDYWTLNMQFWSNTIFKQHKQKHYMNLQTDMPDSLLITYPFEAGGLISIWQIWIHNLSVLTNQMTNFAMIWFSPGPGPRATVRNHSYYSQSLTLSLDSWMFNTILTYSCNADCYNLSSLRCICGYLSWFMSSVSSYTIAIILQGTDRKYFTRSTVISIYNSIVIAG